MVVGWIGCLADDGWIEYGKGECKQEMAKEGWTGKHKDQGSA